MTYTHLEITDRASGEVERIHLDDPNSSASIALAAESCGILPEEASQRLSRGEHLTTAGFVRRFVSS